ncbi:MAG: glycan-binding surface protein [Chitinophagaceae bacterium]|jgi:hypothetical protein|nr:glycan-binding surface protein [Chitinophagaceae bacterium]
MKHTLFCIGKKHWLFLLVAFVSIQTACKKDNGSSGAAPVITSIATVDPLNRDSTFTQALPGTLIHIAGSGFDGILHIYINNMDVTFNSALGSNTSLIVTIPLNVPSPALDPTLPNQIKVVTTHGEATYNFTIIAPPPIIANVYNENAPAGSTLIIAGMNFYDISDVVFPGGISGTNIVTSDSGRLLTVTVPSGITTADTLHITGKYGTGASPTLFNTAGAPSMGFLADFNNGSPYFGWAYWNGTQTNQGFPGNTGQFIQMNPVKELPIGPGNYVWYNNNGRGVMVNAGQWIASSAQDNVNNYAVKFELSVDPNTPWTLGELYIVTAVPKSEYTARYAPWETAPNGKFFTNGWMTVTIPLTSFIQGNYSYVPNPKPPAQAPKPPSTIADLTTSSYNQAIAIVLMNEGAVGDPAITAFNVAVDNVRIVKIK